MSTNSESAVVPASRPAPEPSLSSSAPGKPATSADLLALAQRINRAHSECEGAARDAVRHAIEAGNLLTRAKAAVPHGQWLSWLGQNCTAVSERTAQLYMRVARHWRELPEPKAQRVADLPLREAVRLLSDDEEKALTESQAAAVTEEAEQIRRLVEELRQDKVRVAEAMREVQSHLTPDQFAHWLRAEFGMTVAEAEDCMRLVAPS